MQLVNKVAGWIRMGHKHNNQCAYMRRRHSERSTEDDSLGWTGTETEGTSLRLRNATGCWQHQEVGGDEEVRQDPPLKPSEGMWPCRCLGFRLVSLEL